MADKIYRRTTQPSPILKSDAGKKARKRNVILNFRVTEQEKGLIEKKSDYFIESCLYQKILVKGNIRTSDKMKEQLAKIADALKESEEEDFSDVLSGEDVIAVKTILEMLTKIAQKKGGES